MQLARWCITAAPAPSVCIDGGAGSPRAGRPSGGRRVHVADASEVSRLVRASASGSEAAWNELVRRYSPLVMAVTRSYQLTADDARDVSQTVWLRLVENLANLREPDAL